MWATSWENLFMSYANNKDADRTVHPRSLISIFVIRCLDSIQLIPESIDFSCLAETQNCIKIDKF